MMIVANLPRECSNLVTLAMEAPGDDLQEQAQFADFVELAKELGCTGFYTEESNEWTKRGGLVP